MGEKVVVLLFSLATFIFERINKNLVSCYLLYAELTREGIDISNRGDCNVFSYKINDRPYNFSIKRDSSDALVFRQLVLDDEYLYLIKLFQSNNIQLKTMIDAGANIGLASLYFKAYFPEAQIVALEPVSSTFERLIKNINDNNFTKVKFLEKGLWSGNTFLKIDRSQGSDWGFRLIESSVKGENTIETTSVKSILIENNWEYIDFLKVDIEGGEAAVFQDKEAVNDWLPKVKVLAIEIHDHLVSREDIYKVLDEFNFEHVESASLTVGINKSLVSGAKI